MAAAARRYCPLLFATARYWAGFPTSLFRSNCLVRQVDGINMETTPAIAGSSVEEDSWQVQNVKRRLAPQFKLSHSDMTATKAMAPSDTPKKIIRFSCDELLALRKRSTVLQEMQKFSDIVSMMPLEPLTMKPPSEEEVPSLSFLIALTTPIVDSSTLEQCYREKSIE